MLSAASRSAFGYGDPGGSRDLRVALCDYLGRVRGVAAAPDNVVVCSGYSQALAILSTILMQQPEQTLAFEDPSLPYHGEIAARASLTTPGVTVDADGIAVEQITGRAVVVTPAHQYPLGVTLAPDRRAALVHWAREVNGLVIEDDYDGEFRYDRQPVGALQGHAPDRVVYAGTVSKTIAPALRLGWVVLPSELVAAVIDAPTYSDHHSSVVDQLILTDLITSGAYDRHVRQCRQQYRSRRDKLVGSLAEKVPGVRLSGIAAGLHAVIELPNAGPSEDELVSLAADRGLALEGLGQHWVGAGPHRQGLIVGYATPADSAFVGASRALVTLLARIYR